MNNITFTKQHSGLKLIKSDVLPTLLPLSYIQNNNLKDSITELETPIFLDPKKDTFVIFLCDSFLKDIDIKEIPSISNKLKTVYEAGQHFVRFDFNSLKDLRESFINKSNDIYKFKDDYDNHLFDIKNGELVILACFKNSKSNNSIQNISKSYNESTKEAIIGSTSIFEYFKAYKFNSKYYLLNNDESIDQKTAFNLDKNTNYNLDFLVIPYTEEDWNILSNINDRISHVQNKLKHLFDQQKENTQGVLDKSFSETNNNLLSDFTPKKIKP